MASQTNDIYERFEKCIGFTPGHWNDSMNYDPQYHKSAWAVFSDSPNRVRFIVMRGGYCHAFRANGTDVEMFTDLGDEDTIGSLVEFHCSQCEPPPLTPNELERLGNLRNKESLDKIRKVLKGEQETCRMRDWARGKVVVKGRR